MRFLYSIQPRPDGRWELASALQSRSKTILFDSRALAIEGAKTRCRRHWNLTGVPCGVRVAGDDGEVEDLQLFGHTTANSG